MFTSDRKYMLNLALYHLLAAIFCAVFGGVYELFSHGVYSLFMLYAFLIPLVLGTLPFLIIGLNTEKKTDEDGAAAESSAQTGRLNKYSLRFWISGTVVLTVGCLLKGVLEIFGTTNRLIIVYPVAGVIFLILGLIMKRKS